ncbi:hypothetical protein [Leptospira alexanderi]|uniref:hypothetical protein n=2 Tax=Leptospira alexanderi TaxID=100053 RepID=UPI001C376EF3|nr:hypothetical protein [Leptospira alexanderi]
MILKKYTVLFWAFIILNTCVTPGTIQFSTEVQGVDKTYIKYKMGKFERKYKSNYILNSDKYVFNFSVYLNNKGRRFLNISIKDEMKINPNEDFFYHKKDGLDRNILSQLLVGDLRDNFIEDCEYRMPVPAGKNKLIFYVTFQAYRRSGSLESEFDLPPNHSIRLNFVPKDIEVAFVPFSEEAFKDPKDRKVILKKEKIFEIIASIEPNPEPDEDKPCEIPKD